LPFAFSPPPPQPGFLSHTLAFFLPFLFPCDKQPPPPFTGSPGKRDVAGGILIVFWTSFGSFPLVRPLASFGLVVCLFGTLVFFFLFCASSRARHGLGTAIARCYSCFLAWGRTSAFFCPSLKFPQPRTNTESWRKPSVWHRLLFFWVSNVRAAPCNY